MAGVPVSTTAGTQDVQELHFQSRKIKSSWEYSPLLLRIYMEGSNPRTRFVPLHMPNAHILSHLYSNESRELVALESSTVL